jgi:hypothetical protein
MSKEVILVAGTACEAERLQIFNKLSAPLLERSCQLSYVDGVNIIGGEAIGATPKQQKEQIAKRIEMSDADEYVLVSHSTGSISVVEHISEHRHANAVVLSPPLLNPWEVRLHPVTQARTTIRDSRAIMASHSHPQGVWLPPEFFDEVLESNPWFGNEVKRQTQEGSLKVIAASEDWNQLGLEEARSLKGTIEVKAHHSMRDINPEDLNKVFEAVVN